MAVSFAILAPGKPEWRTSQRRLPFLGTETKRDDDNNVSHTSQYSDLGHISHNRDNDDSVTITIVINNNDNDNKH